MRNGSRLSWFVVLLFGGMILTGFGGCQSGPPSGMLQVFYSGNLTGSLEPCG